MLLFKLEVVGAALNKILWGALHQECLLLREREREESESGGERERGREREGERERAMAREEEEPCLKVVFDLQTMNEQKQLLPGLSDSWPVLDYWCLA